MNTNKNSGMSRHNILNDALMRIMIQDKPNPVNAKLFSGRSSSIPTIDHSANIPQLDMLPIQVKPSNITPKPDIERSIDSILKTSNSATIP